MVKKEQIIMWGSVLLVIIVLGLAFSGGENNYLNPSGNRNPANQKLMVVDQDTGEISFIQKSLQGVNAQIATDDSVLSAAVAKLRTDLDTWNGHRSSEIQAIQRDYATKAHVDGELAKKQPTGNYLVKGYSYQLQVTDNKGNNRVLDVWNGDLKAAGGGSGCTHGHRGFCLR